MKSSAAKQAALAPIEIADTLATSKAIDMKDSNVSPDAEGVFLLVKC